MATGQAWDCTVASHREGVQWKYNGIPPIDYPVTTTTRVKRQAASVFLVYKCLLTGLGEAD
jgi:hypothetical protein